jgi:hypothetical protein
MTCPRHCEGSSPRFEGPFQSEATHRIKETSSVTSQMFLPRFSGSPSSCHRKFP